MDLVRGMIASDRRMREEHIAFILREVIKVGRVRGERRNARQSFRARRYCRNESSRDVRVKATREKERETAREI